MRILQIHNVYQQAGGEDAVVDAEHAMLTQAGHRVERYSIGNDAIVSLRDKVRTALDAAWSAEQYARIHALLADDRPDVVHVHNTFPTITPAVFHACHDLAVPVVATLHNYRLVCAAATLLRDGRPCERCLTGTAYWGAAYACYRGSWLGSLATAHMIQTHRRLGTWRDKVDRLIVLTEFQKGKMIAAGIPAERLVVKPNFLANPPSAAEPPARRHGALFVGRLAPEKGVGLLLEAWQSIEYPLTIIGTGPLEQELRGSAPKGVTFLGAQAREAVFAAMHRAAFLVMPSLWYEGFPMTLVEAYACDLPVIASNLGALAELVDDGLTGLVFRAGDPVALRSAVLKLVAHPLSYGSCFANYSSKYTSLINLRQLSEIYNSVLSRVNFKSTLPIIR